MLALVSLFEFLLYEEDMLVDDGVMLEQLQFVRRILRVLSLHVAESGSSL